MAAAVRFPPASTVMVEFCPIVPTNWRVELPAGIWVAAVPFMELQFETVPHEEEELPVQTAAGMGVPVSELMVRTMKLALLEEELTVKVRRLLPMRSPKGVP